MANWYVYHGAGGAGTGADWTNAYLRLNTALTAKAAGDTFFVADDHVETAAVTTTYTSPGTEANPCFIYCVRRTGGSVPPVVADLRETATVSTTVASNINLMGSVAECYGIIFQAGSGTSPASITVGGSAVVWKFVKSSLRLTATSTASRITIGVSGAISILKDTTVQFGSVSQTIVPIGRMYIRCDGIAFIVGATIPTNLFVPGTSSGHLVIEGADFNNMTSGKAVLQVTGTVMFTAVLKGCKLSTTMTMLQTGAIPSIGAMEFTSIRVDSIDTNYRSEKITRAGRQTTSTAYLRSGGATDGTTPLSWSVITTSTANWVTVFECMPISIWNETVGSPITVTIEAALGGAIPNNREVWMEVDYFGTSGFPLGSRASSGVTSSLDPGTTYPAGAGGWGGAALSFAMSVTITPQEKGPITIYIMVSKPSITPYFDPKPVIT